MQETAQQAFANAEAKLRAGEFEEALVNYLKVVRGVPSFWRARFRVADTLLNLNSAQHSLEIYKALATQALQAGHPLWGLVAIKMAAAMDRAQHDLVHVVADLYSKESKRVDPNLPFASRVRLKPNDPIGDTAFLKGQRLIDEAYQDAVDTDGMEAFPDKLPPIPLFSFLDETAFGDVMTGLQLKRQVEGQKLIEEGEEGESVFILAHGDVMVSKENHGKTVNLARLHYGAVFGEMALVKKAPRAATVSALEDCDLLELRRDFLETEAGKLKSVTVALNDFTHQRFLANLAATSAVFKPVPKSVRAEIIKRFRQIPVEPGQKLIKEGEEGHGLYLIMKGEVDVTKDDGGRPLHLATLSAGSVFGEISLLQATPTTASCTVKSKGALLFLAKNDFNSTMARHPELKQELAKVTQDRIDATKKALEPEELEDDDLILIEDDDFVML